MTHPTKVGWVIDSIIRSSKSLRHLIAIKPQPERLTAS